MYIKNKLEKLNFNEITPIQTGVFKVFNHKKNLVGLAPTGTGKTHAYLLPMLEQIHEIKNQVSAIILVPTNELVIQVHEMLKGVDDTVIVKAYYGSSDKKKELDWLNKFQPQVIISTPQRLHEYIFEHYAIKMNTVKYLILDEADMMFDYDFLSLLDPILSRLPQSKYCLFSASITKEMQPFISQYFGAYDLIDTSKGHELNIEYRLINIKYRERKDALLELVKSLNPYLAFIFVSKKEDQMPIYDMLEARNLEVVNLNASLGVKVRKKIIEDIKKMKYQYVVTSDLAARGLDFKISHVIHYDLPYHLEFFKHRSGRTGRMHDDGIVYAFMSVNDHRKIDKIKKQGFKFKDYELTKTGLKKVVKKPKVVSESEKEAVKSVRKTTKVKPNYKKKYNEAVKKAKRLARRKELYDHNR